MSRNRLADETSPYLLQHKNNPVHWWAWSEEALAEAKRLDKPILLSVGYAACHWCHVMEHESFQDQETARLMNELYINIKVDREERPDIDAIYMSALHRLGEQGGWPLTMFLTSDLEPFWGGTYFPKEERYGRPSFKRVLSEISRIYKQEPARVRQNAEAIVSSLKGAPTYRGDGQDQSLQFLQSPGFFECLALRKSEGADDLITDPENLLELTARSAATLLDKEHGGIAGAPKFPQYSFFWFLWRAGLRYDIGEARDGIALTLRRICQGGIYDHLGGGFARYSVDERWLVPHFEKMLYDNALLIELMSEVWRATKDPLLARRVEETVNWVLREMVCEGGGFAASYDADSEGVEGKFYVWDLSELEEILGPEDAALFADIYDITQEGNFEGRNIANRLGKLDLESAEREEKLAHLRARLLEVRNRRVWPGWDDKVIADWNGLMIAALAHAAFIFDAPDWLDVAEKAFDFVKSHMSDGGRLHHTYRKGLAKAPATASDYANMVWAALRLYQHAGEEKYLADAESWTETLNEHYWDGEKGGYAFTADDTRNLIVRTHSGHDDATPNANAVMASNLVALSCLTANPSYMARAQEILDAFALPAGQNRLGHLGLMSAAFDLLSPQHITLIEPSPGAGDELHHIVRTAPMAGAIYQRFVDGAVFAKGSPLYGKRAKDGQATVYCCIGPQCSAPITDAAMLKAHLVH